MNEVTKKLFPGLMVLILVLILGFGFYVQQPKSDLDFSSSWIWSSLKEVKADADTAATTLTVGNALPSLESLSLNGGSNFAPTPAGVTPVTVSGKLVDKNGCSDMVSITGAIIATVDSDIGCAFSSDTCYSGLTCVTSSCTGSVAEVSCAANIYFFSEPTNDDTDTWVGVILITDAAGATSEGDSESEDTEFTGALCISVIPASIAYGSVAAGSDSGAAPESVLVANVCNTEMDTSVEGTNMTSSANAATIYVSEQQYNTETFTYGAGNVSLLVGAANVDIDSSKPTASPTDSSDEIFWGIGIQGGSANATDYGGINTFTAIDAL